MSHRIIVRRTAGLGLALVAALGLSACGGDSGSTPTETVTVTQTPQAAAPSSVTPMDSPSEAPTASSTSFPSDTPSATATSGAGTSPSASTADPGDPFGGMGSASGPVSGPAACDQIGAFRANLPSNVERDPEGARDAVAKLRAAAPQELRGNLQGLENILRGYAEGNKPMQAVEGKLTGLVNQCRGLANR